MTSEATLTCELRIDCVMYMKTSSAIDPYSKVSYHMVSRTDAVHCQRLTRMATRPTELDRTLAATMLSAQETTSVRKDTQ